MERRLNAGGSTEAPEGSLIAEELPENEDFVSGLPCELIVDEEVLETMGREYIKRLMLNLFEKLKNKYAGTNELKLMLNQCDEKGCAILHYIAALNYHELVQILHDYEANLSLKTTNQEN